MAGYGGEVLPVHDLGDMVGRDAPPVGDTGGAVLIAAGVAAVGVALDMADENGDIAVKDVLVHQHRVAPLGSTQVYHMRRVFGVVGRDLVRPVELVEELLSQNLPHFALGGTGVQAIGEQQQDILLLHAAGVQLLQAGGDGDLPMGGGLAAALHNIGDDDNRSLTGSRQLPQRAPSPWDAAGNPE